MVNNKQISKDISKLKKQRNKINDDPRLSAMMKTEANAKVAFRFLRKVTTTKKLSVLEEMVANNKEIKFKGILAMYIYFHKSDKVTKAFYPNLYMIMNEFEDAVKNARDNDPYFETFKVYEMSRNVEQSNKFLIEARKHINSILEKENISINQLAEFTKIKYANLYNFLVKEMDGKLKLQNVHRTLWMLYGLKEGLTYEESLKLHVDKIKTLWMDWNIDEKELGIK